MLYSCNVHVFQYYLEMLSVPFNVFEELKVLYPSECCQCFGWLHHFHLSSINLGMALSGFAGFKQLYLALHVEKCQSLCSYNIAVFSCRGVLF